MPESKCPVRKFHEQTALKICVLVREGPKFSTRGNFRLTTHWSIFYSNQKFEYFKLDLRRHNLAKNIFLSFVSGGRKGFGQILFFSRIMGKILFHFRYSTLYRNSDQLNTVLKFAVITKSLQPMTSRQEYIFEKLQFIKLDEKPILVPPLKFFEHF